MKIAAIAALVIVVVAVVSVPTIVSAQPGGGCPPTYYSGSIWGRDNCIPDPVYHSTPAERFINHYYSYAGESTTASYGGGWGRLYTGRTLYADRSEEAGGFRFNFYQSYRGVRYESPGGNHSFEFHTGRVPAMPRIDYYRSGR